MRTYRVHVTTSSEESRLDLRKNKAHYTEVFLLKTTHISRAKIHKLKIDRTTLFFSLSGHLSSTPFGVIPPLVRKEAHIYIYKSIFHSTKWYVCQCLTANKSRPRYQEANVS